MVTALPLFALLGVLGFAVARPRGLPEAVVAVPVALLVVLLGAVTPQQAEHELGTLAPTLGFLAAVLVLAHLADAEGVFDYAGAVAARAAHGEPRRLLLMVFGLAAAVTAVLSLDATVVLLTPVVLATAAASGLRARPHVFACTHLANSASLLLPVSNLTNLLAVAATGIGFVTFTSLMAAPWLVVIAVEYLVLRRFFGTDLAAPAPAAAPSAHPVALPQAPRFALLVLAGTLLGFAVCGSLGIEPVWPALVAAGALAPRDILARRRKTGAGPPVGTARAGLAIARHSAPAFLAFVAALSVVVLAVRRSPVGDAVAGWMPHRADLAGLALAALIAAALANLLNLPATLMLVPLVAPAAVPGSAPGSAPGHLAGPAPGLVLAVLLGVNLGPNLSYAGSLAHLLWRQILHRHGDPPAARDVHALGLITAPATLVAAVLALWVGLRLLGYS